MSLGTIGRNSPNPAAISRVDSTPIDSPRYPTNWELSAARALAVTRYLGETGGVESTRLMAAGFGEFRPIVLNDTRAHRALNRRVEIHLLSSAWADEAPTPTAVSSNQQALATTEHLQP